MNAKDTATQEGSEDNGKVTISLRLKQYQTVTTASMQQQLEQQMKQQLDAKPDSAGHATTGDEISSALNFSPSCGTINCNNDCKRGGCCDHIDKAANNNSNNSNSNNSTNKNKNNNKSKKNNNNSTSKSNNSNNNTAAELESANNNKESVPQSHRPSSSSFVRYLGAGLRSLRRRGQRVADGNKASVVLASNDPRKVPTDCLNRRGACVGKACARIGSEQRPEVTSTSVAVGSATGNAPGPATLSCCDSADDTMALGGTTMASQIDMVADASLDNTQETMELANNAMQSFLTTRMQEMAEESQRQFLDLAAWN